jgi:predicted ABC-type ATPase
LPELIIIAGPNGSGKSTLTEPTRLAHFEVAFPAHYINADEIARKFCETHSELSQQERERLAFREARDLRRYYRESGLSYAFETVFSHPSTLLDIQEAQSTGYRVTLLYVTTANPEINVARVAGRVRHGGHDVPLDRIRSRYQRSLALLPRIVEEVDTALVFDSTEERQTRLCFRKMTFFAENNLPDFLNQSLKLPLLERRKERERYSEVSLPQELNGTYAGEVRMVTLHYVFQEVEDSLIQHDRLLLLAELFEGQNVTIKYKDGMGEVL